MKYLVSIALLLLCSATHGQFTKISQEMLNELDPDRFDTDFTHYDHATALFCAQVADAAYMHQYDYPQLQQELDRRYGRGRFKIVSVNNQEKYARALIVATDRFVVVGFRGTQVDLAAFNTKNIATDLGFWSYVSCRDAAQYVVDLPAGHGGFRGGSLALIMKAGLFDSLRSVTAERSDSTRVPVFTTGHSMGAGYANLFIPPIARYSNYQGSYLFAPPLTVECSDAADMENTYGAKIHNIVHYKDFVARAGGYCRSHFHHTGQFYRLSKTTGELHREPEHYAPWTFFERNLYCLLKYHKMGGYLKALRSGNNATPLVEARYRNSDFLYTDAQYPPVQCTGLAPADCE